MEAEEELMAIRSKNNKMSQPRSFQNLNSCYPMN